MSRSRLDVSQFGEWAPKGTHHNASSDRLDDHRGRAAVIKSEAYRRTLSLVNRFARHERATILLEGEAGTGKTTLARLIHHRSPRAAGVFHRVDLGTLDDPLSSSDLFGHAPGSFTGAAGRRQGHLVSANRGTLFLDEIGKASLAVQRRLLHVIEYGEFTAVGSDRPMQIDVRIVAASNVPLETLVEKEQFLPDLLPRFGFFRIRIPPLRERPADIPQIVLDSVVTRAKYFGYENSVSPTVSDELMDAFVASPWPGNVRELISAVDYLLVAAEGARVLQISHCDGPLKWMQKGVDERQLARDALRDTGSVAAAARKLGIARTTMYRHLGVSNDSELRGPA